MEDKWIENRDGYWPEGLLAIIAIEGYVRPVIGFYQDGHWWRDGDEEPLCEYGLKVTHYQILPDMPAPAAPVTV